LDVFKLLYGFVSLEGRVLLGILESAIVEDMLKVYRHLLFFLMLREFGDSFGMYAALLY
jgi:hypothetical protein